MVDRAPEINLTKPTKYPISVARYMHEEGVTEKISRKLVARDIVTARNAERAKRYKEMSITDGLTGLYNPRYLIGDPYSNPPLIGEGERQIELAHRKGAPLSVILFDGDSFKSYNDEFGHTEGNKAISAIGEVLEENLRRYDLAVRYGGEEFIVLAPQTTSEGAVVLAERIRKAIEGSDKFKRRTTVSIGVASLSASDDLQGILTKADIAMYEAKQTGKNRVVRYQEKPQDANTASST